MDTWAERDLPVLKFLVERFDDPRAAQVRHFGEIAEATGLSENQVERAVFALAVTASPPFVVGVPLAEMPYPIPLTGVTERARRAAGAWPTPEGFAEQFVSGLAAAIEREPDPEKRSRLRALLGSAGGAVKDISVEVAAAVISRSIGGE